MLVVAAPLAKLMTAPVPKSTAAPFLSLTVGAVTGLVDELAPAKVRVLSPV